ncbi:MAG: NarK/NasA family nitrate transporter [Solirubrobacterales bacterium]|nr:NarK/NasA family nitrate transporter [Solirubrobacterales bacterium]MCB8916083.1 NarK/NasA family nitrate transporter [Thermoleophilales bacterium]
METEATGGSGRNLTLATIAFAACFSAWGMLAPIAPDIQKELDLSNIQTSIMISIPVVLGSLLRIPLGLLTDRIGGRVVFTAMLFYSAGAAVLVGFASSYATLLGAGFLLGAAGASFAVGVPFVSQWYSPERQGVALGVYGMGNIGTAIAAFSVPAIRDSAGQEVAGLVFGAVVAVYALIWMSLARQAPVEKGPPTRYGEVLRSGWKLWRLALFYFVTFGGFVAMALYLPKLLVDWFDLSLTDAGLRAAGFTLLATASRPIGGMLSDRIGGNRVLAIAFLGVGIDAIGLSWQASVPNMALTTFFCLTMAMFLGLGSGAVFKLVPLSFPKATGAATGIVGAAGGLGGFFPPLFLGVVKDATGDFVLAFVLLVAFAWLCAGLAFEGRVAPADPSKPG